MQENITPPGPPITEYVQPYPFTHDPYANLDELDIRCDSVHRLNKYVGRES